VSLRTRLLRGTLITTQPPVTRRVIDRKGTMVRYAQENGPYTMTWWQRDPTP